MITARGPLGTGRGEVRNAFERLVGRNPITREEFQAIQAQLDADLDSQRLARVPLDLDALRSNPTG
jgi:hypothetical protein